MIYRDVVKVQRNGVIGTSPTGSPKTGLLTIFETLKCDLQPDNGIVVMPQAGQTAIYYKNMFCDAVDIQPNDIVTDLSTLGKFKVVNPSKFNLLKHLEVRLQGGTV